MKNFKNFIRETNMKNFKNLRQELTETKKLPTGHGSLEVNDMPHPAARSEYHDDGSKNRDHYKKAGIKAHALHSTQPGYYRVRLSGDKEKLRDFAHKHLDYNKKNHPTFDHLKHAIGKDQGDHE